jgi:hypothetical protein
MVSAKLKWILAIIITLGLVIAAQAALPYKTHLPVVFNQSGPSTPTAPSSTPTFTPTGKKTPTATATPTPTPTKTSGPLPTLPINTLFEIELQGPDSTGMGIPNPFLIEVEATFTGPVGQIFVIPGFYDGDGSGGMNGNVWKVRFTPDSIGEWTYTTSSQESLLNGHSGGFVATSPQNCTPYTPGSLPDFSCVGRLKYAGGHYLQFANGQNWFKAGINDPEAFLDPTVNAGFPSFVEAIDFLADKGVNAQYMLLNNLGGDGSFLYPWVGDTPPAAKTNHERYDLAKLRDWEEVFNYGQSKGIVLHLVFEDDSGWTEFNRDLYYRQMIARFGHYNGLIWNITEEFNENYTAEEVKQFAQMITDLDPYDHPLTVHHLDVLDVWLPFIDDARFDLTSFQQHLVPVLQLNEAAVTWFNLVDDPAIRTIPISFDEIRYFPGVEDDPPLDPVLSRHAIWGIFMGGGIFELRIYPDDSYIVFEQHITDMHRAREFMEKMPYWQMKPVNSLLVTGKGYVFSKPGDVYSIYLYQGGQIELDLTATSATYYAQWFNPRDGSYQPIGSITGGGITPFTTPDTNDWVLLLD